MKHRSLIEELEIENYEIIKGEKALRIAHKWLSIFYPEKTSFKGILRGKTYMWDLLKCEHDREEALGIYKIHDSPKYVVMEDCFGHDDQVVYITKHKPENNNELLDFHVYPTNFAWSMAFTHEDGWIGPKFLKHSQYEKLNFKNIKALRAINQYS